MRCPSCGSEFYHVVEETETRTKGFGIFKGCCGLVDMDLCLCNYGLLT